jgi:hypothetical protein
VVHLSFAKGYGVLCIMRCSDFIQCFFCNEHTVVVVLVKSNLLVIQEGSEQ